MRKKWEPKDHRVIPCPVLCWEPYVGGNGTRVSPRSPENLATITLLLWVSSQSMNQVLGAGPCPVCPVATYAGYHHCTSRELLLETFPWRMVTT